MSPVFTHTLSTLSDIAPARSATDFLCVQSSSISPIFSINITDAAVLKSRRRSDTVTAVASSTATDSLPLRSAFSPCFIYFHDFITAMNALIGAGINVFDINRATTVITSLSSNSRLSFLDVWSGTNSIFRAFSKAKAASALSTAFLSVNIMTASQVRSYTAASVTPFTERR